MRFLLLQVRDPDDPMRANELAAFARALCCPVEAIAVHDVLKRPITEDVLRGVDLVLIGGSGKYSAVNGEPWLLQTLAGLRLVYQRHTPMFASCWGFQALARALGGKVVNDRSRAEVGTRPLHLTEEGRRDPLFGALPSPFLAQMGHEDHVVELPPGAVLLASSEQVANQAYTFADRPIYATQFHTELCADDLLCRVRQYPEYLKLITGLTFDGFRQQLGETPDCAALISRFVELLNDPQFRRARGLAAG